MAGDEEPRGYGRAEGPWDRWHGEPARLSEYVLPASLTRLGLDFGPPDVPTVDARRHRVEQAWEALRGKAYPYRDLPWQPRSAGQWVRDPQWFAVDSGTCLDFTLVWVAMCMHMHVAPLVVVARNRTEGHAFAAVDLRRGMPQGTPRGFPLNGAVPFTDGVAQLGADRSAIADLLGDGELLAIDVVGAAGGVASLDMAMAEGAEHLTGDRWDELELVDVPGCWFAGHRPRRPADAHHRPAVTRSVPRLPGDYRARPGLQDRLAAARRRAAGGGAGVVLHGDQGMGKSLLAQQAASTAPAGWFLNASDRTALIRSLARADNGERYEERDHDTADDAMGDALNALDRLRRPGPWTVVVDNCNVAPGEVADLLPQPGDQQVLLVTTTNTAWREWAAEQPRRPDDARRWEEVAVGPLTDDEARALGCPAPLLGLAAGRPLFAKAFSSYLSLPDEVREVPTPAGVDPAASTLWALATRVLDEPTAAAARAAAWFQPDAVPVDALAAFAEHPADHVVRLEDRGIVTRSGPTVRIHRLVAAAVRATTPDDEAVAIIGSPAFVEDGEDRADNETIATAFRRLDGIDPGGADPEPLARALWSVMTLMEPRNQVNRASDVGRKIESLLADHAKPGEPAAALLADALHDIARWENQRPGATPEELLAARDLVTRSRSLRESLKGSEATVGVAKSDALDALLLRGVAKSLPAAEKLRALYDALGKLEESHRLRQSALGDRHSDTARAVFNLGGAYVQLAQADEPSRADGHLQAAHNAYKAALETREDVYRTRIHIHYAASYHGIALALYYRALLAARTDEDRVAFLRQAAAQALEGLDMRQALDVADGPDVQKSLALLAKVSDARLALGRSMQAESAARRRGNEPDLAAILGKASTSFEGDIEDRRTELTEAGLLAGSPAGEP